MNATLASPVPAISCRSRIQRCVARPSTSTATSASLYGRGNVARTRCTPLVLAPLTTRLSRPIQSGRGCSQSKVVAASAGAVEGTVGKEAYGIRRIAWISFWGQLSLAIVSAVVVFFTMTASNWGNVPPVPVLFTLFGVATSFISTFLSFGMVRTARKVIEGKATIQKESIAATLLANQQLNLWGIGSALIGLQATVGTLVAKVLTSSTQNPYQAAGQVARTASPTALDAFSVQACTNTILAHFASIVFANWLQKILLKPGKAASSGIQKPDFPDYTQKRGGPTGAMS